MIADKFLSDMVIEKVMTDIRLDDLKVVAGDYSLKSLSRSINVESRNKCIVQVYLHQVGRPALSYSS